jgi:hypothetical protein
LRDHKIQLQIKPSDSENCPQRWAPFQIDLGCFEHENKYGPDGKWKYTPNEPVTKEHKFKVHSKKSMKPKPKTVAYTPNILELKYPLFDLNGNLLFRVDGMRDAKGIRNNEFSGLMRRENIWDLNILQVYLSQIIKYRQIDTYQDLTLLETVEKKVLSTFGSVFSAELVKLSLEDITEIKSIWYLTDFELYGTFKVRKKTNEKRIIQMKDPTFVLRKQQKTILSCPAIKRFWSKLSLVPLSGSKDIQWISINSITEKTRANQILVYLQSFSDTWKQSQLGTMEPFPLKLERGVLIKVQSGYDKAMHYYMDQISVIGIILLI